MSTVSGTLNPVRTRKASETALSRRNVAPSWPGVARMRVPGPSTRGSGCSKRRLTALCASPFVRPLTESPPIVTASAIVLTRGFLGFEAGGGSAVAGGGSRGAGGRLGDGRLGRRLVGAARRALVSARHGSGKKDRAQNTCTGERKRDRELGSAHHRFSVATKIRGSFVITPSAPAVTTRSSSARVSTVQASTEAPQSVRCGNRGAGHEAMVEHHRRGAGTAQKPRHPQGHHGSHRSKTERDDGPEVRLAGDGELVLRIREAQPDSGRVTRHRVQRRDPKRADDRAVDEAMPPQRRRELVETGLELEVDVQPDVVCLVGEERERVVERGQLRCDLAERCEGHAADPAGSDTVAHLLEVVGVGEHERAANEVEHVELDHVDTAVPGGAERAQGVLRSEHGCATMPDAQHRPPVACREIDHPASSRRRARRSHQNDSAPSTSACATVIAAASCEVCCQNTSG